MPQIIPPVFNKANATFGTPIWKAGLDALRICKNLIICGYSLPTTDSYMQYFLKAALGPNRNLNQIFVFDPLLFDEPVSDAGEELKKRYSECFAPQMHGKIVFQPPDPKKIERMGMKDSQIPPLPLGTFQHMVELFGKEPESVLFGLGPKESSEREESVYTQLVRAKGGRKNRLGGL